MLAAALSLPLATGAADPSAHPPLEELIDQFVTAATLDAAGEAARRILALHPTFESVYRELGPGRRYRRDVGRGILVRDRVTRDGRRHPYLIVVPEDYDPGRSYPLRVALHGGVNRPAWRLHGRGWADPQRHLVGDRITVLPAAWAESKWWQESQLENVPAIVRDVSRSYNVDENRVSLLGASDGGTGAWFFAFRHPTLWASYVSLIGSPAVLANPASGASGSLFVPNLYEKALLVINGTRDPLYPAAGLQPLVDLFSKAGASVEFLAVEGGHDLSWRAEHAGQIDAFVETHRRDPLPDHVFWASDRPDRAYWVVLEELSTDGSRGEPRLLTLGPPPLHFGWIEVRRRGNAIEVLTLGVRRYRLLLSPEEIDFDEEVVVTTNGVESFRGQVPRSIATLLAWAARDMDRTMLFAGALLVDVPPAAR